MKKRKKPDRRSYVGEGNPMWGRKRPDLAAKNRDNSGEKHPFYGKKRPEHAEKLRGRKHSVATRQKQSEGVTKAIAKNPERNNFIRDNPAKKLEIRKILSGQKKGKNNPAYVDGHSSELYGIEFNDKLRFYIRDRDDFTCQFCGTQKAYSTDDRQHIVHHINYKKKSNKERNLLALCCSCNFKANSNRAKWEFCFTVLNEIRHLTYPIGGI